MEKVEVKPTWRLAWGLFWKMGFIAWGIYAIIFGIMFAMLGPVLFALLRGMYTPAY